MNRVTVESGTTTALGSKKFMASRVVEHANLNLVITPRQRDRYAKHRITMGKVRRSVQWIDVPAKLGVGIGTCAFLTNDSMLRPARMQTVGDQLLRSAISRRHQIDVTFVFNFDVPVEVAHQQSPGFASDGFEIGQIFAHRGRTGASPLWAIFSVRSFRTGSSAMYAISCLKIKRFGAPSRVSRTMRRS